MSTIFLTLNDYFDSIYPDNLPPLPDPGLLNKIWIEPPSPKLTDGNFHFATRLLIETQFAWAMPGVAGVSLFFNTDPRGIILPVEINIKSALSIKIFDVPLMLRISRDLLEPMRVIPNTNPPRYEVNHSIPCVDIDLGEIALTITSSGMFDFDHSGAVQLPYPVRITGTDMIIDNSSLFFDFSGDDNCLGFTWLEQNVSAWLGSFSSALKDNSIPASGNMALRLLFDDAPREIRVDWAMNADRILRLPGLMIKTPKNMLHTVVLGGKDENGVSLGLDNLSFLVTCEQNALLDARSTFAWERDAGTQRELLNDGKRKNQEANEFEEALFRVALSAEKKVSLILLQIKLSELELPSFFKQLPEALSLIDPVNAPESLCQAVTLNPQALSAENWVGVFQLNLGDDNSGKDFKLPFLNSDEDGDGPGQFIGLRFADGKDNRFNRLPDAGAGNLANLPSFPLNFAPAANFSAMTVDDDDGQADVTTTISVIADVNFGSITLETDIDLIFGLSKFSLKVEHDDGIKFMSDKAQLGIGSDHLGLTWSFEGKEENGRYHYFTLTTDKYAYGLQQAKGAKFIVGYHKLGTEPVQFALSDFLLSPKGVNITAEVMDNPVRLNGIDTRFRFNGTKLIIIDNAIQDFTLAGSGPLPPDLVGDAIVDIHLQMAQRNGNLDLVMGHAYLQGTKLLDCKGTRFQFSVDGLGIKFVNENGYHLYFLITGQAQFVLGDRDEQDGALSWLPTIKIELVKAPLTGDMSVLKNHVKFLVELPKPKSFNFLGAFEMEVRGIGFVPSANEFDGDGAMELTGQLRFAQGLGDTPDSRTDYHRMLIGLPPPGSFVPRIYFKRIALNINFASAFKLNGFVEFIRESDLEGFQGEGMMELQGLPSIAASFAFMRVKRSEDNTWVRAWFIYLEARRFSIMIPVIQIYFREIGFGFGYRYTIASIKESDEQADYRKLLQSLKELSRTQGNLSRLDSWALDLEDAGQPVRWTVVLRALISQTSASAGPQYNAIAEQNLSSMFVIDALIAFRSDLTFFMAARAWINTNYHEFDTGGDEVKNRPLFSGFVLLKPRDKTFLMHVSNNKDGYIGKHPELPGMVQEAIKASLFSATLLVAPKLIHYELGWPNMMGWDLDMGILRMANRGGFIFRLSDEDFVIGISYESRGELHISAGIDLTFIGLSIEAHATMSWGARLIAIIKHGQKDNPWFIYGAIGVEMSIYLSFAFWVKIPLGLFDIKKEFRFSSSIAFTAALEAALTSTDGIGVRGRGTLSVSLMGHGLQISASFKIKEGAVKRALDETKHVLDLGMEATEVEPLPGLVEVGNLESKYGGSNNGGGGGLAPGGGFSAMSIPPLPPSIGGNNIIAYDFAEIDMDAGGGHTDEPEPNIFHIPGYSVYVIREPDADENNELYSYFLLFPQGEHFNEATDNYETEAGFLPVPPLNVNIALVYFSDTLNNLRLHEDLRTIIKNHTFNLEVSRVNPNSYTPILEAGTYRLEPDDADWKLIEEAGNGDYEYRINRINDAQLKIELVSQVSQFEVTVTIQPDLVENTSDLDLENLIEQIKAQIFEKTGIASESIAIDPLKDDEIIEGTITKDNNSYDLESTSELRFPGSRVIALRKVFKIPLQEQSLTFKYTYELNGVNNSSNELTVYDDIQSQQLQEAIDSGTSSLPPFLIDYFPADMEAQVVKTEDTYPFEIQLGQVGNKVYVALAKGNEKSELRYSKLNLQITPENDFRLVLPLNGEASLGILEQYVPETGNWVNRKDESNFSWKVNWKATVLDGNLRKTKDVDLSNAEAVEAENKRLQESTPTPYGFSLADYLVHAYKTKELGAENILPLGDPTPIVFSPDILEDDRVHNPSDDAFEAAVRGAFEQFEGSPYFRRDPNNSYDRALGIAFDPDTTVYVSGNSNSVASSHMELRKQQIHEQATHMRSVVIQDIIADLQQYFDEAKQKETGVGQSGEALDIEKSIAFQMGLVFRFKGEASGWLNELLEDSEQPKITQRETPYANTPPSSDIEALQPVVTFNTMATNFSINPPLFQRIRHYSSSNTIAVTWDLFWDDLPEEDCTPCQADPEHHLMHYRVHRRVLDGSERDQFYTVKNAMVLQSAPDVPFVHRLRPRFRIVDHFNDQSEQALADLPEAGRSYQYTITPVDFEGNPGRPYTLIVTRFPDAPPLVPVDAEFAVIYNMTPDLLSIPTGKLPEKVLLVEPQEIRFRWSDPGERTQGINVPVKSHRFIFRNHGTLPIGSYGLDSETQRPVQDALPTSNARPLPTDTIIEFERSDDHLGFVNGQYEISLKGADLDILHEKGILAEKTWQAEAWRVFTQTKSVNGVYSALAPVALSLIATTSNSTAIEELRPAELEFIAEPIRMELLLPEDQRAISGLAHFPMPGQDINPDDGELGQASKNGNFRLMPNFDNIGFRLHPANLRAVRFRWNQGPGANDSYPLDLNAGYYLMELDIDANTTDTFDDPAEIEKSLRNLQEIQMLPANSLLLEPGNTFSTSQWEAWYPTTIQRLRSLKEMEEIRSETRITPYYSWRESVLEFPPVTLRAGYLALFNRKGGTVKRNMTIHPYLDHVIALLNQTFNVTLQTLPARQPQTLNTFMQSTGAEVDPYGWKVLQSLGLSIALSVRDKTSNKLLTGTTLIKNIRLALGLGLLDYAINVYVRPDFVTSRDLNEQQKADLLAVVDSALSDAQTVFVNEISTDNNSDFKGAISRGFDSFRNNEILKPIFDLSNAQANALRENLLSFLDHLNVAVLFQPGRSIHLDIQESKPEDALAVVQISLRPRFRQYLKYYKLTVQGLANETVTLRIRLGKGVGGNKEVPATLINMANPAGGPVELEPDTKPILREITFPINGEIQLYFRSAVAPIVSINLSLSENMIQPANTSRFAETHAMRTGIEPARLEIKPGYSDALDAVKQSFIMKLPRDNSKLKDLLKNITVSSIAEMPVTETVSTLFTVPDSLKSNFANKGSHNGGKQWHLLRDYLESLNGTPEPGSNDPTIEVPVDGDAIEKLLPDFIAWSQRFFDYGGDKRENNGFAQTDSGPWLVTAYPRAGSPAYASPDEAGRLRYDHIYQDRWAHTYRYYIQPYGRYDKLWYSFRHSRALNPNQYVAEADVRPVGLDPQRGGLDIVLERSEAVEAPIIISSRRLDAPGTPGTPALPGKIWEVIIAKHPEQELSEHNQSLARNLAFRQIAFTMLRRYSFEDWIPEFNEIIKEQRPKTIEVPPEDIQVRIVEQDNPPSIPDSYPETPAHIDLNSDNYTGEDVRSLNVMGRTGRFQQGALVLQWDSLPFYYTHRLLTFAQTANTVSRINEVTQEDFEYRTPEINEVDGIARREAITEGYPVQNLTIPTDLEDIKIKPGISARLQRIETVLKRFWDSLPDDAKARWEDEKPDDPASNEISRKFSSLPDLDVVYQLVQTYSGNLEVQAEIFNGELQLPARNSKDAETVNRYQSRQLGRELIVVQDVEILAPDTLHGDYRINLLLIRLTALNLVSLHTEIEIAGVPTTLIDGERYLIGALTAKQYLLLHSAVRTADASTRNRAVDFATLKTLYDAWTHIEPVTNELAVENLPISTAPTELVIDEVVHLVWDGSLANESPISDAEKEILLAIDGDKAQKDAIARLIKAIEDDPQAPSFIYKETMPVFLEEVNTSITSGNDYDISFIEVSAPDYQLILRGFLFDDAYEKARQALDVWTVLPELRQAVDELYTQLDSFATGVDWSRMRPADDEIPLELQAKLITEGNIYRWVGDLNDSDLKMLQQHTNNPEFANSDYAITIKNLHQAVLRRFTLQEDFILEDDDDEIEDVDAQILPGLADKLIHISHDERSHTIRWDSATYPDDTERELLIAIADEDTVAGKAVRALLETMFNIPAVLMPPGALEALTDEARDMLRDAFDAFERLLFQQGTISWTQHPPTSDEVAQLEAMLPVLPARLQTALIHLLAVLNATNELPFPNLPESLLDKLTISADRVQWSGIVTAQAELQTLNALTTYGDNDFASAIENLIEILVDTVFELDVNIPGRGAIPDALRDHFMITRNILRYTGMMSQAEGNSLMNAYQTRLNRNAVERLYEATVNPTIDGRTLKIRARRGSASPSHLADFYTPRLTEGQ